MIVMSGDYFAYNFFHFNVLQLWHGSKRREAKKRDAGNNEHAEGMAKRAQEESVSHER